MAWNGSKGEKSNATASARSKASKPSVSRGVVAGVLVVALAVGAYFLFFDGAAKPEPKQVPKGRPSKVVKDKPARAPKPRPEKVEPEKPKELPPQRIGELRNGYRLLPSGRLHRVKGEIHVGGKPTTLIEKTFPHGSDRMIAYLLTAEPGGTMIDDSESIMRGFNEVFAKSLEDEIVIDPDDTDEVKELKQSVLAARKEIQDHMADGHSAEEVMVEARNQLLELTLYHDELKQQVMRLAEDGMTQKDYDELIGAANLMLEERGIGKIKMPKLVGDAIEMRYRHEVAELEQKMRDIENKLKEEDQK